MTSEEQNTTTPGTRSRSSYPAARTTGSRRDPRTNPGPGATGCAAISGSADSAGPSPTGPAGTT